MHRTPEERVAELRMLFDMLADHAAARMRRKAQEREANIRMTMQASNDDCCRGLEDQSESRYPQIGSTLLPTALSLVMPCMALL